MEVRAVTKYIRMSSQKMRLVADLVRGADVNKALDLLQVHTQSSGAGCAGPLCFGGGQCRGELWAFA